MDKFTKTHVIDPTSAGLNSLNFRLDNFPSAVDPMLAGQNDRLPAPR